MTLNPKSLGLAGGVVKGLLMFIITILAVVTGYGVGYLESIVSLFPMVTISITGSVLMLIYGFILGFITFYLIGHFYNKFES